MNFPEELKKNFISTSKIICIVGQEELETYLEKNYIIKSDNFVAISVHEPDNEGMDETLLKNSFNDYLKIAFWDIRQNLKETCNGERYYGITEEQGEEIFNFIIKNLDKQFVIHCKAGISRSAGIGVALEYIYNTTNQKKYDIENNGITQFWRYKPNLFVTEKIIKHI